MILADVFRHRTCGGEKCGISTKQPRKRLPGALRGCDSLMYLTERREL